MRIAPVLFILALFPALLQVGSPAQTYATVTSLVVSTNTQSSTVSIGETTLSQLTTSTYSIATGTIPASYTSPATGQQICYYVPYMFHVSESVHRVIGTVSGSSPFNFYIMSQTQYKDFVNKNPPCGASYTAITLDYQRNEFKIDLAPGPGDYYVILENISSSTITYTIQISAVGNASNIIYSTMQILRVVTSTVPQITAITTQPVAVTTEITSASSIALPVAIIAIVMAALVVLALSKRRRRREDSTQMY